MTREVMIGDTIQTFRTSAAFPIFYKELTGREFFEDVENIETDVINVGYKVAHAMYRYAGGELDLMEWVEQFEFVEMVNCMEEIVSLLLTERKTSVEPKKKGGQ